ncbi:uncharacterized protein [Haliotis asinina]|uniref:uncharacterized protein n=1 Tax=Haliotis asinina TaxID=109174 RepID=UPI003532372F
MRRYITGLGLVILLFYSSVYCRRVDNDYMNMGDDQGSGRPGGMGDMMELLERMRSMGSMMGMNGERPDGMPGMNGERPDGMPGMNGERPDGMPGMNGERPDGMPGMNGGRPGGIPGMNGGRPGGMPGMNGGRPGGIPGMNGGRPGGMPGMDGGRPDGMSGMNGGRPDGMPGMNGGRPGGTSGMDGRRPDGMPGMNGGRPGGMGGINGGSPGGMGGMNGGRPGDMEGMLKLLASIRGMGSMMGMNGGRPGGMPGMNRGRRPDGMGDMNGGRPGGIGGIEGMNLARPGGMRGMNSGRPGGMGGIGGMSGGRPGGMGGRRSLGNRGNGGGSMTLSKVEREKMKAARRARQRKRKQMIDERKRQQDQNKITYVVKGMVNFTSGDFEKDSTMMKLYMDEYKKLVNILGKRRDILMKKMRVANLGGQVRTAITLGSFKHTKKVSAKWNGKCLHKFKELVEHFGENPTGNDLKKAKAILERVTGNYMKEVKKLFDDLSQKVDNRDKGYFIDTIKQDAGNARKKQAMIMDVRKISASLGCAIQEKKVDLEPYHSKDYKPTAAEEHLMKRLGSVRMNAISAFMDFQKDTMADITPEDRTLPIDIETIRNGLKTLEEKKDELLKKAIDDMEQIVDEEQVDPALRPLKEKLSEIAQKLFEEEKDSRRAQLKAIMDDIIGQVADRAGAGTIEGLLRRRSMKAVDRYGKAGGSLQQKVAKASVSLKSHVLKVMDKALENLKQFGARKVKALKQGKGIFGRLDQLHKMRT